MPTTYWKCPECGDTQEIDAYELPTIGDPMCSECPDMPEMERWHQLRLSVVPDLHALNPADDGVRIVSFNRNHVNFEHPDTFREDGGAWTDEIKALFAKRRCFLLGYHEHGDSAWYRTENTPVGADPWDSTPFAGLLFVPDDVPEGKEEDFADAWLEEYTNWCNGWVYGYSLGDQDEHVDSCWGFYDWETMLDHLKGALRPFAGGGASFRVVRDEAGFVDADVLREILNGEEVEV